jgi:uncharacterized membrane protein YgdD (TMEM256/DUF423 family)
MTRWFFLAGSVGGFLGVAAGAFGAHALREILEPRMLEVFETAVRYQMLHSLALLAAGWVSSKAPGRFAVWSGGFFVGGIVLFSGSLYLLTLAGQRWAGAVTPLGGAALLAGWACLALAGRQLPGNAAS